MLVVIIQGQTSETFSLKKRSSSSGKLLEPKKKKKDNRICIIHFERHKKGHIVNELTDSSFTRIKEVKQLRQNQVSKALRYDEICQTIPDQYDTAKHFYHRWCYQMFTNISRLIKSRDATEEDSKMRVLRRESNEQSASLSCSSGCFLKSVYFARKKASGKITKKKYWSNVSQQLLHYQF